jgi:hypothetical protein
MVDYFGKILITACNMHPALGVVGVPQMLFCFDRLPQLSIFKSRFWFGKDRNNVNFLG